MGEIEAWDHMVTAPDTAATLPPAVRAIAPERAWAPHPSHHRLSSHHCDQRTLFASLQPPQPTQLRHSRAIGVAGSARH